MNLLLRKYLSFISFILGLLFYPEISGACAVCFGDPSAPMTLGAKAGVAFLLGVIVLVLGAIVGVGMFWAKRARLLEVQEILHPESRNQ